MNLPTINSTAELTNDNIDSLAALAENLSRQEDNVIETIVSSSVLNPEVQRILDTHGTSPVAADESSGDAASDDTFPVNDVDSSFGLLSFPEETEVFGVEADASGFWLRIKSAFTGLRKKVRRLFCTVVSGFENDKDLNLKQIIKDVLLIVIPAFAGAAGLMPVVLPIVVSLAAILIKHGVSKVCPV